MNQQRIVDVLLDYVGMVALGDATCNRLDFLQVLADVDAVSAVRVLAWLQDPSVHGSPKLAAHFSQFPWFVLLALVGVFTAFGSRTLLVSFERGLDLGDGHLVVLLHELDLLLQVVVVGYELLEFGIA